MQYTIHTDNPKCMHEETQTEEFTNDLKTNSLLIKKKIPE